MKIRLRGMLFLGLMLIHQHVEAKDGGGGKSPLMLGVALNWQRPQPSTLGTSINLSFGHLVRLGLDVGVYAKTQGQTGGEIWWNSLAATLVWMVTLGKTDWRKLYNTFSGTQDSQTSAVLTSGASVQFFVPTWKFSPAVGMGYASWAASPAEALDLGVTEGDHVYYTAGVDYAYDGGFFGVGASYAPKMPSKRRVSPYVTAGVNWKF